MTKPAGGSGSLRTPLRAPPEPLHDAGDKCRNWRLWARNSLQLAGNWQAIGAHFRPELSAGC